MKGKDNSFFCICIPTYQHCNKVKNLVTEILKSPSVDISVVVSDNNSTDGTYEQLKKILDPRLKVYKNEVTISAKMNWYRALEYGNGEYICHLNDTDFIDISLLDSLLDLIKKREFDYGYHSFQFHSKELAYKKNITNNVIYYDSGYDGMMGFGFLNIHPSGVIFKKTAWESILQKRKYFEDDLFGIYPHGFIFAELAKVGIGAYFDVSLFHSLPYDSISKVYKRNIKKDFFWSPEENYRDLTVIVSSICDEKDTEGYRLELILQRFRERLYFCTILYAACESTPNIAMHYQFQPHHVFFVQQYRIGHNFCKQFKKYIQQGYIELYTDDFLRRLRRIERDNIIRIIQKKLNL